MKKWRPIQLEKECRDQNPIFRGRPSPGKVAKTFKKNRKRLLPTPNLFSRRAIIQMPRRYLAQPFDRPGGRQLNKNPMKISALPYLTRFRRALPGPGQSLPCAGQCLPMRSNPCQYRGNHCPAPGNPCQWPINRCRWSGNCCPAPCAPCRCTATIADGRATTATRPAAIATRRAAF